MRSQILRDIVAGCAGALLVLALIGLPGRSLWSGAARSVPAVHFPMYKPSKPTSCQFTPPKPVAEPQLMPCFMPLKPAPPAPAPSP